MNGRTKQASAKAAAAPMQMVYLGPTIAKVAVSGTVYSDGLPPEMERIAGRFPVIQALIVPVTRYAEASAAIRTPGTGFCTMYTAAEDALAEIDAFLGGRE